MSSDPNARGWLSRLAPGVRKRPRQRAAQASRWVDCRETGEVVERRRLEAGFTGRRAIAQTLRQTLPAEYQTAEFLTERGMVDQVVQRKDLPSVLGSILATRMMGRDRRNAA